MEAHDADTIAFGKMGTHRIRLHQISLNSLDVDNSYHASERACVTSQFEQLVRAVCDLPLGEVDVVQPAAIANLLGDVWLDSDGKLREPRFDAALAVPGVRLHLYEKHVPRKGRKMGHLSAVGASADEAVELVLQAKSLL